MWFYLLTFLTTVLPALVWLIMRTLGFGLVTYAGLDIIMTAVRSWILTNWDGLPSDLISILALAGADVAAKILIAAYVTGFSIQSALGSFKGFKVR